MPRSNAIEIDVIARNKASSVIKKLDKDVKDLGRTFSTLDKRMEKAFDTDTGQMVRDLDEANTYLRQIVENTEDTNRELRRMQTQLDGVNKRTKKVNQNTKKTDSSWKQLSSTLRTVRSLLTGFAAAFGLQQIIQLGTELVKMGAAADAVAVSYRNLTTSVDASGQQMLATLRRVSLGTIKDTTLMETANAIMLSTGSEGLAQLPRLLEIARASALATGKSFDYVFKTLVDGVSRGEPRLIDNANIYIKIGDAVEAYAKSVGKAVEELDDLDRRFATLNAVMGEAPGILEKFGGATSQAEINVNRLSVALINLKEQAGAAIAEAAATSGAVGFLENQTAGIAVERYNQKLRDSLYTLVAYRNEKGKATQSERDFINAALTATEAVRRSNKPLADQRVELDKINTAVDAFMKKRDINVNLTGWDKWAILQKENIDDIRFIINIDEIIADEAITKFEQQYLKKPVNLPGYALAAIAQDEAIKLAADLLRVERDANRAADALNGLFNNPATISSTVEASANALKSSLLELHKQGDISGDEYVKAVARIEKSATDLWHRIRNMSQAEADVQISIWSAFFGNFIEGLDKIEKQAKRTFSEIFGSTDKFDELSSATDGARSSLLGYVKGGTLGVNDYAAALQSLKASSAEVFLAIENMDEDAAAAAIAAWDGETERYFDNLYKKETATKKSNKSITADLEKALFSRREATKEDMALTNAGKYQDAPLENARRLDAIMARGFAELSAHPDWAGILRIPESVLSGSDEELKAWAAERNKIVGAGASVDDVNWDSFLAEYEANLKIAEGKAEVLAKAAQVVYEAGHASSYAAAEQSVKEMTGQAKAIEVTPEFDSSTLATSFTTAFVGVDFGSIISKSMMTSLSKKEDAIKNRGKLTGEWFGDGFSDGVEAGLSGLVESIVAGLLNSADGNPSAPTGTVPFDEG